MFNDKSHKSQNMNLNQNESEVSENLIKQVNYLQKVIGNKEVEGLISNGIINNAHSQNQEEGIIADQRKKEKYELEQIQKDKEAIIKEVEQRIVEDNEKANTLYKGGHASPVYVNVKTHLIYAEIPGTPASLFYHYTDLVDVAFSYQDINKKQDPHKMKRGEYIPYTFSFKYKPVEDEAKQQEEETPEEESEKEATQKKENDKVKKEEISATILNAEEKIKKNS